MDISDAKVRLFFEFSHPQPVEILSYTPLSSYDKWKPSKMYDRAASQYYYAFINDREVVSKVKEILNCKGPILEEVELIKEDIDFPIEFNGYSIEDFQDDNTQKGNSNNNTKEINNNSERIPESDNKDKESNRNSDGEQKYAVFCRFNFKNFGFIHDYNKLQKEDFGKLNKKPIIYALKGRIKTLLNLRLKELESKKEPVVSLHTNINMIDDDKTNQISDKQTLGYKKEMEDKNKSLIEKDNIGIDGHWFMVNNFDNLELLSLIKYKEIYMTSIEIQDKINEEQAGQGQTTSQSNATKTQNTHSNSQKITNPANNLGKYLRPFRFFYYIKEAKKLVSIYQNKSCEYHHNKNEFICKTCGEFCCLECMENYTKDNKHYGHKIALLDEACNKLDEDAKNLEERIIYLKDIIENEILEKKNEIAAIKNKNEQIINQLNEEHEKLRIEIQKEEINRAKVLGFLGNESLRIVNDYHLKFRYLKFLYEQGDMNSYLMNYFLFEKYYKKEISKNLDVLERKIILTAEKFKTNNTKLINLIDEIKKNI